MLDWGLGPAHLACCLADKPAPGYGIPIGHGSAAVAEGSTEYCLFIPKTSASPDQQDTFFQDFALTVVDTLRREAPHQSDLECEGMLSHLLSFLGAGEEEHKVTWKAHKAAFPGRFDDTEPLADGSGTEDDIQQPVRCHLQDDSILLQRQSV